MPRIIQGLDNKRMTGQTATTTTVTKVGDTSSGNTTFTATTVVDASAWDLSGIEVGDVAVTSDSYKGVITAINDGTDTLTIGNGWQSPAGAQGRPGGTIKPTDTSTVTIHRIAQCKSILLKCLAANGGDIRIGLNGAAVATDYPLPVGANMMLFHPQNQKHLDVTDVYIRADSGTQTMAWIVQSQ
jgi:hypothetical protein